MASRTPTNVYGPKSFNSLWRFCKKPFLQNSSSIPIFSVTQRYGIFVQDDSNLSSRSCPKCARRILTSCKTLQEVKQAAQAGPSPRNPSVKGVAKNSPSAGPRVSVDGSNSHHVHSQRRARKKLSLGKDNLPVNEIISEINRVERLDEEIRVLMNVPVEETQTITKVNV